MIYATVFNEGFGVAIVIWAVLVTLMMVHATLVKRRLLSADEHDSPMRPKNAQVIKVRDSRENKSREHESIASTGPNR